jgi:hypothetical protein
MQTLPYYAANDGFSGKLPKSESRGKGLCPAL